MSTAIPPGTVISHFRVVERLGAGGMGEIYLAVDTSGLERNVALKFLPAALASDLGRMQRFTQEARAVSRLNHPNILTVYEFGQWDSARFIATEHIEGETLRRRLSKSPPGLLEALDIAAQVADALAAAHKLKIIHRDIKPENIMIRAEDGLVKVLDFGLAKSREEGQRPVEGLDEEAPTKAMVNTAPGVVLGTVAYMSPEQARGQEVDERTDIWSLGVVLYEIVAGCLPFVGASDNEVISAILSKDLAPPMARYAHGVPERLEEIVAKALTKDREERYQSVKDLLIDLKRLRHHLDVEAEVERSTVPDVRTRMITRSGQTVAFRTGEAAAQTTASAAPARSTSDTPAVALGFSRRRIFVTSAALVLALAGLAFGLYLMMRPKKVAFESVKFTKLTTSGRARFTTISPDGKYVAHVVDEGSGQMSLWVRHVATNSNVQIVPPTADYPQGPTAFSPDGNYVYFGGGARGTFRVPVLGGQPKKILEDANSAVTFSPDGKRLAFVRGTAETGETSIVIAGAEGGGEQTLVTRKGKELFSNGGPSWSPDGALIACGARNADQSWTVVAASVADGSVRPLTARKWPSVARVAWLGDGSGIIVSALEEELISQIWQVSYPGGEARRVTNDSNNYGTSSLGVTADSGAIVTIQVENFSNLFVAPAADIGKARQTTSGPPRRDYFRGISWTPDGRLLYSSGISGNNEIWVMNADGTGSKQLTDDPASDTLPAASPDGRYVVFRSTRSGSGNVWRMDADGGHPQQLTGSGTDWFPVVSPDSRWVVYESSISGTGLLYKVSIDGGQPTQLTDKRASAPAISPDGRLIACFYQEGANTPPRIAVIPFEGGAPVREFDAPTTNVELIRWTSDGRSLLYVATRGVVSALWSQPLDGGKPVQSADFQPDSVTGFDISRDGKQLAYARASTLRDVVLIGEAK